jgi:CheY-like chemotaxis protein
VGDEASPCIEFYIQDSGIGIAPENLDKIFKKFFRGTTSYQGIYAGHGVGLHIVKRYIQLLKGDIQVESTPGKGTRFTVTIPAKIISPAPSLEPAKLSEKAGQAPSPALANETARKIKLLLIEDNAIALQTAVALLKQLGIDYVTAINGQQAVEIFKQQEFDMVLSDIGLPDISGLEVARQIRVFEQETSKNPTPIYGLTAHSIVNAEPEGLQAGMDQVLSKPVRREMLLELIDSKQSEGQEANNTAPEPPLLDEQEAISILGCRETMLSIWADFIDESQKDIKDLQSAWSKQDYVLVQHLAHKMKSSALYCGAVQMKDACQAMEHHFKHQSTDSPARLYEQLCSIVTNTIKAMKVELN